MSRRRVVGAPSYHPRYVVWELTLKCDLACRHCGSRAGRPRAEELSLAECEDLVEQLAAIGAQEITFIGGEAYLHPDWLSIIAATAAAGMRPTMTTGARRMTAARASCNLQAKMRRAKTPWAPLGGPLNIRLSFNLCFKISL